MTERDDLQRRRSPRRLMPAVMIMVCSIVAALLGSGTAQAGANSSRLYAGEILDHNTNLVSTDGQYILRMQDDGNLVLYAPGNRVIWATGTSRPGSYLGLQGDGNLVVYAPGPTPVWASGTSGSNLYLELQTDGNAVLYNGGGGVVWSAAAIGTGDHANVNRVKYNAYVQMRDAGWPDSEWSCLDNVYTRESAWRWNATNGAAYGIPQANPGNKMATAGSDWHDNAATQVKWGLGYLRSHGYGSPCGAWSYWQVHHNY